MRRFDSIDSTNTWLLGEARRGAPAGLVAVAAHQTAGRGRLGRSWEAPPGRNLLGSVLLRPEGGRPGFADVARVSLAAREAAAGAAGPGFEVGLKWPNDLVVEDRKLAGVLAEVDGGAVVVGIGMNVGWAPPSGACRLGDGVAVDDVLVALLASLGRWVDAADRVVMRAYREACVTLGRRVRVELADEAFDGVAADVSDTGALLVETPVCLREVAAADVVHLR